MAKTRLLKSDRDAICAAIISHKFTPIEAALLAEENTLAEEARRHFSGAQWIKTMDTAPSGVFAEDDDFQVNVSGKRITLKFGATRDVRRRIFHKHNNYDGRASIRDDEDLGARIASLADRRSEVQRERSHLESKTEATLAAFNTFDDLLTAWPHAEKFIKARWQTRPEYAANVPMVALNDLAAALDLPPEAEAA